jgi:hypothetical protein
MKCAGLNLLLQKVGHNDQIRAGKKSAAGANEIPADIAYVIDINQ